MNENIRRIRRALPRPLRDALKRRPAGPMEALDPGVEAQRAARWTAGQMLRHLYREVAADDAPAVLRAYEARVYSQNGEDGILLHLFHRIGARSRRFVEFGIGDGTECCAANLAINFSWSGLFMDADAKGVQSARRFYASHPGVRDVRVEQAFITRENIDDLLRSFGAGGEVDLLSVDIDGNDYWVWEAIGAVEPRVVVVEYNASFGPARSLTVAYDPRFDRIHKHPSGLYHGASLAALAKLGVSKGYVLAGCDSMGINAFFVRSEDAAVALPAIEPLMAEEAYVPNQARAPFATVEEQFRTIAHLPLVDV